MREVSNPFPLILNRPKTPILNPLNIVPICNKGEVLLLAGGGDLVLAGKGLVGMIMKGFKAYYKFPITSM